MNGNERPDMIKHYSNFLKMMEELKPLLVEYNEDSTMKLKIYTLNSIVKGNNFRPIIIVTYNEYKILVNNGIQRV